MKFVYWTIQFIILRYNMDMMIDYTNLLEISAKRIRNTKETFIRSIDKKIKLEFSTDWNKRC